MKMLLALIAVLVSARPAAASMAAQPSQTCQRRCGDVEIPYPFGIGRGCYRFTGEADVTFGLACNLTADGTYRPFCGFDFEVLDVSLRRGKARVRNPISSRCYNGTSRKTEQNNDLVWDFTDSWFHVADEDNRFTVVGCNSLAYLISGVNESEFLTGCMATCPSVGRPEDGTCSGMGCCQAAIPRGINSYGGSFEDKFNTSGVGNFSRCSYAVLVEAAAFEFRTAYVAKAGAFMAETGGKVPLVLDWVVGKETCREAKRNASDYMCVSSNSECVDSRNGPGYLCNCSTGYEGNPYLLDGCQDVNECEDSNYPCSVPGTCINTPGGFDCICPDKTVGNARIGTCDAKKSDLGVHIAIGVSCGVVVLVLSISGAYLVHQKRSLATVKRRYFKQHGGLLLFEEMKSKQGLSFTLFTKEELEEATNKFDERHVLGKGGNGTVYRGTLKDSRVVAIKKCKLNSERQKKEFGKEMLILSQINHRNIVKIYGCCLEVEVPMLVYEFIPNGTLYQLIHGGRDHQASHVAFATRLKIAHEAGEALAYLHSWASPPIIHGDVKSPNILIGDDHAAKVTDFGASTLAPTDEAQLVTLVQGTCGYLDPEYMQTSKLTDRSDVYSFGVVLLELLTRRKALNLQAPEEEEKNLSAHFLQAVSENRLEEIVDAQIVGEQSVEVIEQVAELARQCLEMAGEKRPSMREVAEELGRLRKLSQHPWGQPTSSEELHALLAGSPSACYVSLTDSAYLGIQSPR